MTARAHTPLGVLFLAQAAGEGSRAAPYGAACVAAAVKAALGPAVELAVLNAMPDEDTAALAADLAGGRPAPHILGLSLYVWNADALLRAAAALKRRWPGLVVVAGGPDASARGEALIGGDSPVDLVVRGEGEGAMTALCDEAAAAIANGRSPAGALLAPGRQRVVSRPLESLDALPSPWLDGTLDPAEYGGGALELTRGCPYRCAFCYESKGDSRLRRFPLERARAELKRFKAAGVDEVFVLDPTFNAGPERMEAAVKELERAGLRYFIELRGELVTGRQAALLSRLDCVVQLGLQSADPEVLKPLGRGFDAKRFAAGVRALEENGILYGLDLIYGLPRDGLSGFKASLDYAIGLGPNHLDMFRLAVLPGTALADSAEELGLSYDREPPYLVRGLPGFSAAELSRAERLALATAIFYNQGRAVMWLRPLLEALGMSASAFLEGWADHLEGAGSTPASLERAAHAEIERLQLAYVGKLCRGDAGFAQAAAELILVSGAWTRALAEGEATELELSWDPEELLDYAPAGLRDFPSEFKRRPARWRCEPGPEGPRFTKARAGGIAKYRG